jgi:hypothetical protein
MSIALLIVFLFGMLIYCFSVASKIEEDYVPFKESYTLGEFLISILTFPYYIFHKISFISLKSVFSFLEFIFNLEIRKRK